MASTHACSKVKPRHKQKEVLDSAKCSKATSQPQLSLENWTAVGVSEAGSEDKWFSAEDLWPLEWQPLENWTAVGVSEAGSEDKWIVLLVTYLDRKMEKYSEPTSLAGSYVKLVRRQTKAKAVATARVIERIAIFTFRCVALRGRPTREEGPVAITVREKEVPAEKKLWTTEILLLLQYLDWKREKYAEASITGSYVKIVQNRTKTKVAAATEVAAKECKSQPAEAKYQALQKRRAEEIEKRRYSEKTPYDVESLRVDELTATTEKKEQEYKAARISDLELKEKLEARCSELRTQRSQAEEQLCEMKTRLTKAEGKNWQLFKQKRDALTARGLDVITPCICIAFGSTFVDAYGSDMCDARPMNAISPQCSLHKPKLPSHHVSRSRRMKNLHQRHRNILPQLVVVPDCAITILPSARVLEHSDIGPFFLSRHSDTLAVKSKITIISLAPTKDLLPIPDLPCIGIASIARRLRQPIVIPLVYYRLACPIPTPQQEVHL
ncbi:hypothetical protein AXG93_3912s1050 [Marchantia polymorpha subsp. ruderalis]|uniref:Uncharacterized protein n=1 Tax=Marchantia polymorpha subsp. ruderalis TaxID=1480154 RepID=A0A176VYC0_MARPO|nr:hypothetical protein AXG93_3912s1050 [Marchantia polymorpha subsp. ruderalis]